MRLILLFVLCALLLTGCAKTLYYVEYYPPSTPEEQAIGHGSVKILDYRKPQGMITVFGFSIF